MSETAIPIVLSDLRMGIEEYYVFSFEVAKQFESGFVEADFRKLDKRPPLSKTHKIFARIMDANVKL